MENLYCRLCVEPKNFDGLLNLDCDETKCNEIHRKLSFLNAMYVNVLSHDNLPKNVCYGCYDSLNKAYDFLDKVKKAQDKLKHILIDYFPPDDSSKLDYTFDDDRAALDEFFGETHDIPDVKPEALPAKPKFESVDSGIEVKLEPKEEFSDPATAIHDSLRNVIQNSSENLSIQDILDSALCKTGPSNIYAKEVKEVNKKTKSWKEFLWLCAYCAIEFTDLDVLRSHSKVTHNKCAAFSCADCKTFTKSENLESFVKHVRKHRKGLRDRCHFCDEIVKSEELKDHLKEHHKNNVPCPMCGEILPNEESLMLHHAEFKAVKQIRKPRRKKGTPITIEDLTCHICKNIYKNPNSLRDHIKRHTTERKRDYTCDRCGKTFYNKGTLTTHVMAHDQIRRHVCRICNKSFVFPNMLRRHVEMHSGIKPFSCEICGRCFRLQYQLNAHKIVHTDSMPHVCKYCNKAFRFKQILKNHERQHTGAKPYSCEHCCMEFSNWSNYNKHMKRRHNLDTSKKKITPQGVFPFNSATGQIIQLEVQGMEEWKSKVMIPAKRGKKKKEIKEETVANVAS
ncbi:hypothetical protein O0L34_g13336 [Tuta absoluta]|nr:hypothetical protein O0L34_g13336 [Tuta absoluta]